MKQLAAGILTLHVLLLAHEASRAAPTFDETGHLVAGLSHWKFSQFDLYRVNPPLVRLVATFPLWLFDVPMDWSNWRPTTMSRQEFRLGSEFIERNGRESLDYFMVARWMCIPFSLLGALLCGQWAKELYGRRAGVVALSLWCFSPNILGHGALITPDVPAAAMGIVSLYLFRDWLRTPGWGTTIGAGAGCGIAMATKSTWIFLLPLYLLIWCSLQVLIAVRRLRKNARVFAGEGDLTDEHSEVDFEQVDPVRTSGRAWFFGDGLACQLLQFTVISALSLYILNSFYAFDRCCQPLDSFEFMSTSLGGGHEGGPRLRKNRFKDSWLGHLPVPLPGEMLQGIDRQKSEFERNKLAWLGGQWRNGGWWYYYVYALGVKLPTGTLLLLGLAVISVFWVRPNLDECLLLMMAMAILLLVSSNTGINKHLRYVFPAFPAMFILASRGAAYLIGPQSSLILVLMVAIGSLTVFPYNMSYFNAPSGGPNNGANHLLNSNISWGQDNLELIDWQRENQLTDPLYCALHANYDPTVLGLNYSVPEAGLSTWPKDKEIEPATGWYAIDVNILYGYPLGIPTPDGHRRVNTSFWTSFKERKPESQIGYSVYLYKVP